MAEVVIGSPGVTTRELDLSAPGVVRPQGIPAGVIGTSQKGPAFVPVNFATVNDFANLFGATEGKHFGAMAVNEWMRTSRSGIFIRTLGVGDAKKADSYGVTTNAGFVVGSKMRDKDNVAGAAQETDGAAYGLLANPYAGDAVPDAITKTVSEAGTVAVTHDAEEAVIITVEDGADNDPSAAFAGTERDDFDGYYAVVQNQQDSLAHVFFLSSQSGRSLNTATVGRVVKDGTYTVKDFSSIAGSNGVLQTVHIVDISAQGTANAVATTLAAAINGVTGLTSSATTNSVSITQGAEGAGTFTRLTGATGVTTVEAYDRDDVVASAQVPVSASTAIGVTAVSGVNTTMTLTADATDQIAVGSTIVVRTPDGVNHTITVVASGGDDTADFDQPAAGNATATAIATCMHKISGVSAVASSADVAVTLTAGTNGQVLPTVTITENSPGAPMGRTHFLGCKMKVANNDQDYLGIAAASTENILRGVIMFASGVIPGLYLGSNIGSSDMPASSYGGVYASGKDQGDRKGDLDASGIFKMVLNGFTNTTNYNAHLTGSFDPTSPIYFPRVLNTDPTKIQERGHYLYAHYDVPAGLAIHTGTTDSVFLTPGAHDHNSGDWATASSTYQPTYENWKQKFTHASTPWIMSQTLGTAPKKLFKFHMLDAGSSGQGQVKISIANIQKSTDPKSAYGKFDVQIRRVNDLDSAPVILQSFSGVNLNPSSDRYIARVIGDQNTFYEFEKNPGKQKLVTEGLYPNKSQYVRVQVVDQVESGAMEATALPIAFAGKHHLVLNGDSLAGDAGASYVAGAIELKEPPLPFRQSVSIGQGNTKVVDPRFYWGLQIQNVRDRNERNRGTGITSLAENLTKHFPTVGEYPQWVGDNRNAAQGSGSADLNADTYNNNFFSLERILVRCKNSDTANAVDPKMWHEAIYVRDGNADFYQPDGASLWESVETGSGENDKHKDAANHYRYLDVAKDFAESASKRFYKFTVPMQGGFDGLDIFDKDKSDMSNLAAFREMSSNTSSTLGGPDGPTTAGFRKAIDILAEKSDVDIQLLAIPGMRDAGITDYAIDKTEERFDALYIMDMPAYDHDLNLVTSTTQETSVTNTAQTLVNRNLDTSFAATYFPDLVVQDGNTNVVAPSSVAVLGAMSLNDSVAHPWYAPAGFARGALTSTIEASVFLNRPNMDVLYNADINPITSFPNSGESVVIFGQKTMLQAQSALDRVNVRRLLIDVRRKVRTVANTILFEPNRESTLARFSALVNPILGRIQQQQGLDRYKVVIDTTTTTQQDVENNTIRGKIFLQPTRSVEFISLDFVVTNAGAEI